MPEEFKPIRITLSEEAFDRLDKIMKDAKFRSYSSTIEECIRVVSDIIGDLRSVIGKKDDPFRPFDEEIAAEAFTNITVRMDRFTGRKLTMQRIEEKHEP